MQSRLDAIRTAGGVLSLKAVCFFHDGANGRIILCVALSHLGIACLCPSQFHLGPSKSYTVYAFRHQRPARPPSAAWVIAAWNGADAWMETLAHGRPSTQAPRATTRQMPLDGSCPAFTLWSKSS